MCETLEPQDSGTTCLPLRPLGTVDWQLDVITNPPTWSRVLVNTPGGDNTEDEPTSRRRVAVPVLGIAEREVRTARDDDVVEHADAQHLAGSAELRRDEAIGAARRGITTRMKVAMFAAARFATDGPSTSPLDVRESADIGLPELQTDRTHRPTGVDRFPERR